MNYIELEYILKENKITFCDIFREDYNEEEVTKLVGNLDFVYEYGGEGIGDTYIKVIYFSDHNIYVRFNAYYNSEYGIDYNNADIYEVTKQEKTIIIYE